MEKIVLHTTGCPRCSILKKKLDAKGISYEVNESTERMEQFGISHVPVLQIGEELLDFSKANEWVNGQKGVVSITDGNQCKTRS